MQEVSHVLGSREPSRPNHPSETGRTVMLASTTATSSTHERPRQPSIQCAPLAPYADTLMLTRGVLRNCIPSDTATPIVLRVSGASSVLNEDLSDETIITSIEEVIRMNAVGMALSVFVGAPGQHQSIANLAKLVDEGERWHPVVAVTAVGKSMGRDARYLSLASRICGEMGAHIVKTYYCEDFEKVSSTCPVPVVVAGGKKLPERRRSSSHTTPCRPAPWRRHGAQYLPKRVTLAMIQVVRCRAPRASVDEAYELS